jgi:GntR family transcriptional regulator/MocR family aminotransferase
MAYITPSHQFPLGRTLSQTKRLQLLQWARQHQLWILEDDYDSEFRYEGNPLASVQGLDIGGRVIYTGTFSKVLFPGLRLAYIVLPSTEMVGAFQKIKQSTDRQSPILEQLIVARFMEEGYFLRHIRKMRLLYAERQAILVRLLQEQEGDHFRLTVSPSGMHILCRLPDKTDLPRFREEVKKAGLNISFINDYTRLSLPPTLALGFTAFSKYRMRVGIGQLVKCLELALLS